MRPELLRRRRPRPRAAESSWAKATWALVYYVVFPSSLITIIGWRYPELSGAHLQENLRWVLLVGTLIVGVSALRADHPVGTRARFALDSAYVGLAIVWLLGVLGGDTVLDQSWQGHPFSIDISRLFVIVAALASLNWLVYALQFEQARGHIGGRAVGGPAGMTAGVGQGVTIEVVEDGAT
jgi:hypothetical protein